MIKVLLTFHDGQLHHPGEILNWTDRERIEKALQRGLIEETKPAAVVKEEPKPKAPAKKKK